MILKKRILQISFSLGLLTSNLFVGAQIRVIDNKGTLSTIDISKWTRIDTTNDIYNKYLGNVGIGTSTPVANFHNAGSTLFGTLILSNFTANGDIGTAAATVDSYTSINIPQTTVGVTLNIPPPSNTTAGRIVKISNSGTTPFTIGSALLEIAQTVELVWNGTAWSLQTGDLGWSLTGNGGAIAGTNFLGTTTDVPMNIASNNTTMLQVGRRQTLGLYDSSGTGLFPSNQANNPVAYLAGGSSGVAALQFQADAASFYKPIMFTDTDGNFKMRGSAAGTDFFELGSAGTGNNGQLVFTIGDDGNEPMIFRKYNYSTQSNIEMMRLQGTGLNNEVRVGINTGGAAPTSTLQIDDVTTTGAVQSINATGVYTGAGLWNLNANSATTGTIANINANVLTSGTGLAITGTGAAVTGNLFRVQTPSTSAFANGGVRFNFTGAHTGSSFQIDDVTTTGAVQTINASGAYTGTGLWNLNANAATTGTVADINTNSLTSGTVLSVSGASAITGALGDFVNTGASNSTNGLLRVFNNNASTTGIVFRAQSNTTAGTGLTVLANNKVGAGTDAPNTTLDVNGDVALRMGTYTAANGVNNNIVIGNRSFIRITGPTAAFSITGMAGGYDGKMVILYNTTTNAMTITNNATSTATNRIYTLTNGNLVTSAAGGSAVTLIYDAISQRWIVTAIMN